MKHIKLGYVVRAGSESIKTTLGWYSLDSIPRNRAQLDDDIKQTFENIGPRTVQVYRLVLVPVGPRKGRSRYVHIEGESK